MIAPSVKETQNAEKTPPTPGFPKAILSCTREELTDLELTIRVRATDADGKPIYDADGNPVYVSASLPSDLQGHVFITGAAGCVASEHFKDTNVILPSSDGWTNLVNGDGIIYRIDFHQTPNPASPDQASPDQASPGKAWLTTRLVKPPAFYADYLTNLAPKPEKNSSDLNFSNLKFVNLGIARFSWFLGMCTQVNTSLQFIRFKQDASDRLIVTNDASRPYQIDPCSLKTLAPVGLNRDWEPMMNTPLSPAFPLSGVMSTAHPCVDPLKPEFLLVNVQRSIQTTLRLPVAWNKEGNKTFWPAIVELILEILIQAFEWVLDLLSWLGLSGRNRVYLARWNGGNGSDNGLEKWKLVLPTGKRVKIRQSTHMMGITENHVLLADTAFKLAPKDMVPGVMLRPLQRWLAKLQGNTAANGQTPDQFSDRVNDVVNQELEWLEERLTYPQSPDTQVYVIARNQLDQVKSGGSIQAQQITIPGEFAHFLTDYDETPDGKILIHAAMTYATDPAEFVNQVDTSVYGDSETPALREMVGMWVNPMDVNSPATIAIDPTGKTPPQKFEIDPQQAWKEQAWKFTRFMGLYAYSDGVPTRQLDDIYWTCGAADPKLFTQDIYDLYQDYKYRHVSVDQIKQAFSEPNPMYVLRVHLDRAKLLQVLASGQPPTEPVLAVADFYQMPAGYAANSPQFIPRNGEAGSQSGYILCGAIYSDQFLSEGGTPPGEQASAQGDSWSRKTELWIFDAQDLRSGPLYKLSHAKLNMGLTLHTAWSRKIAPISTCAYDVAQDFEAQVAKAIAAHPGSVGEQIKQLFDQIYQLFNAAR